MSPPQAAEDTVEEKRCHPSPLATHEEVVSQPELFFHTLKSFHSLLGTRFMVPVIGKKVLDLHVLYVEVTRRGGYDKVVINKKWREISSLFNFSATTTSASFVLKRHYYSLLYQYEQVYFFNSQAPVSSSPSVSGSMSIQAVGTIDGKFDSGYLVSVKLGDEVLCGVIYHPSEPPPAEDLSMAIVPYSPIIPESSHCRSPSSRTRKKRKRKRWGGDTTHPKPNRSGYNFFFAEQYSALKSLHPNREREFTKMIGESWNKLGQEERAVYQEVGFRDKERYKRELKEYHERLAVAKRRRTDSYELSMIERKAKWFHRE